MFKQFSALVFFLRILLSPLALFRFIGMLLIAFFFLFAVIIENKLHQKPGSFQFWSMRNWGKAMIFILGFRIKKNEFPKVDTYLLMPNHRSYLDIFIMAAISKSAFVAKAEVRKWPILGLGLKSNHTILVQRNEIKSLLDTMKQIKSSIEQGISITIFPEGTTFEGLGTKPFKSGTFKIVSELNVPIIPCAIEYEDKGMAWVGTDTFVPHFFRMLWQPVSKAEIKFGQPIIDSDYSILKSKTYDAINQLLLEIAQAKLLKKNKGFTRG